MSETILVALLLIASVAALFYFVDAENKRLQAALEDEKKRVSELHDKLMSRSYGEYASFHSEPDPDLNRPQVEYLMDQTGLIQVESALDTDE